MNLSTEKNVWLFTGYFLDMASNCGLGRLHFFRLQWNQSSQEYYWVVEKRIKELRWLVSIHCFWLLIIRSEIFARQSLSPDNLWWMYLSDLSISFEFSYDISFFHDSILEMIIKINFKNLKLKINLSNNSLGYPILWIFKYNKTIFFYKKFFLKKPI